MQKYLSAFESGALQARSLNERVKEIEDEIALLKERKRYLEDEINRSKIQPVTVESVRKVIGKLEEVISSASPSEKRAFIRNIIKTIKVHSRSYIEPYYRIPSVRIMSGLAPRTLQLWELLLHLPPQVETEEKEDPTQSWREVRNSEKTKRTSCKAEGKDI